jgi:hypothetical protein
MAQRTAFQWLENSNSCIYGLTFSLDDSFWLAEDSSLLKFKCHSDFQTENCLSATTNVLQENSQTLL